MAFGKWLLVLVALCFCYEIHGAGGKRLMVWMCLEMWFVFFFVEESLGAP